MDLTQRLNNDMKEAMKAKDALRLTTIRLMRTAIKNREIESRTPLSDQDVIGLLSTLVKQRRESAQVYRENDRLDMAEKEEQEIAIIQDYLPQQMTQEEIAAVVEEAVAESGAEGMKDMGKVMKLVTARTTGRADNREVSEQVKARLARG